MAEDTSFCCGALIQPESKACPECGQSQLLLSRYRIIRLLTSDKRGSIYEAVDINLDRQCLITHTCLGAEEDQRSFWNEARLAAAHNHDFSFLPDISNLLRDGPDLYVETPYMAGPTLANLLEQRGAWKPAEVVRFLHTMLSNLARLHRFGLVVASLTPENIKLTPSGRYVLIGVGLAREGSSDIAGSRLETGLYISPEQQRGEPIDRRSNLYSLAAIAQTLLNGGQIAERAIDTDAPAAAVVSDSGIRETLEPVIQKMLASTPVDRPANARAARALLGSRKLFLLAATLALAAIPPLLVVQDRWLEDRRAIDLFRPWWCRSDALCQLGLPPYFLAILTCLLIVGVLVGLWRKGAPSIFGQLPAAITTPRTFTARQRQIASILIWGSLALFVAEAIVALVLGRAPQFELLLAVIGFTIGWILREIPTQRAAATWRSRRAQLLDILLVHVAIVGCVASYFAAPAALSTSVALFGFALAYVWRKHRVPFIVWIVSLAIVLYSIYLNAWWFALIGDEYIFYNTAVRIAWQPNAADILANLFNGQAIYNEEPFFSSLLQAGSIKLFGNEHFGWQFSNIYLSALAIAFLFYFFKMFVRRETALLAAFLLACSEYLMGFGKVGYNNLQAYFALALVLCSAGWAARSGRALAFLSVGLALGLCLYVFPAALYIPPVAILLLLMYRPPRSWSTLRNWGLMALSFFMLLFPLLFQTHYWTSRIAGTFLANQGGTSAIGQIVRHLVTNLIYSAFSFLYDTNEAHFVSSSYVDPLMGVFVLVGAAYLFWSIRREKFATFLILSFGGMLLLAGTSHQYQFPPTTRMFLLLPWFALFAAIGITWAIDRLRRTGAWWSFGTGPVLIICLGVMLLNLYQAYPLSQRRMAERYQGSEVEFLRVAQDVAALPAAPDELASRHFIVFGAEQVPNPYLLRLLVKVYQVPPGPDQVEILSLKETQAPPLDRDQLMNPNTLVVVDTLLKDDQRGQIAQNLQDLGKIGCSVHDMRGRERFTLWVDPSLEGVCQIYQHDTAGSAQH